MAAATVQNIAVWFVPVVEVASATVVQQVITSVTPQHVVSPDPEKVVRSAPAADAVVADVSHAEVAATSTTQTVGAGAAEQRVAPSQPAQQVTAGTPIHQVVAVGSHEHVASRRPPHRVGGRRATSRDNKHEPNCCKSTFLHAYIDAWQQPGVAPVYALLPVTGASPLDTQPRVVVESFVIGRQFRGRAESGTSLRPGIRYDCDG